MSSEYEKILTDAYRYLELIICYPGKFEINEKIRCKVECLEDIFNMMPEDIISEVYSQFLEKKLYIKASQSKGKLSTFMTHFTFYTLNNLIRKLQRHQKKCVETEYTEADEEIYQALICVGDNGLFNDRLINNVTPEKCLMAKELSDIVNDFFGLEDLSVITGIRSAKDQAYLNGVNYQAYLKRLSRKRIHLRTILNKMGYYQ